MDSLLLLAPAAAFARADTEIRNATKGAARAWITATAERQTAKPDPYCRDALRLPVGAGSGRAAAEG